MSRPSRQALLVTIFIAAFLAMGVIGVLLHDPSAYSSPIDLRPSDRWDEALTPPHATAVVFHHPDVTETSESDESGNPTERAFAYDGSRWRSSSTDGPHIHVVEANENHVAVLPGGARVRLIGGALSLPGSLDLHFDWRDLENRPLGVDELSQDALDWEIGHPTQQYLPKGAITMHVDEMEEEPPRWLGMDVFDATTQYHLGRNSSYITSTNDGVMEGDLAIWNPTPILITVDLAVGPFEVQTLPLESAEKATFSSAEFKILGVDLENTWSASSRSSGNTKTFTWSKPNAGGVTILAHISPRWARPQTSIKVIGESKTGPRRWLNPPEPRTIKNDDIADAKEIEITYRPTRCRVVFRLERFPGLPESAKPVDNLFKTPIGTYRAEQDQNVSRLLGSATQFEVEFPGTKRDDVDWLGAEDETAQQLLERMRVHYPIRVDSKEQKIIIGVELDWVEQVKEWWKELW